MPVPRSALLPVFATLALLEGCFGVAGPSATPAQHRMPSQLDSAPNSASAWVELEAKAGKLAAWSSKIKTDKPLRLSKRGFSADPDHQFDAKAGRCYSFGVAWSYQGKAQLAVAFPERDGQRANAQMAGRSFKLPDVGRPEVCADEDGPVQVRLYGVTPAGVMAHNALVEYAVVIGSREESPAEAAARREAENLAVENERQRQAANIAAAEERERRRLAQRCRDCSDAYRACQVTRHHQRRYPRRGVTYAGESCERKFQRCSQNARYSGIKPGIWPCGAPPR